MQYVYGWRGQAEGGAVWYEWMGPIYTATPFGERTTQNGQRLIADVDEDYYENDPDSGDLPRVGDRLAWDVYVPTDPRPPADDEEDDDDSIFDFGSRDMILTFGMLVTAFGAYRAIAAARAIYGAARLGLRGPALMRSLAPWIVQGLAVVGIAEGADWLLDDESLPPEAKNQGIANVGVGSEMPMGSQVVKEWTANGTAFVRLADGRMGAFSTRKGTWKLWRPEKPVVLTSKSNVRDYLRADARIRTFSKRVKKMLNRTNPTPRRAKGKTVIVESGPGNVIT